MSTRKPRSTDDFAAEIRAHLALETDRLIAEGMPPEMARLGAVRRFGNVTRSQERFYESHRWLWLDCLRQDVRDATRSIVRYPVAALVAVLSLGAGIGAMTATLTIRNAVFYSPPPLYLYPDQLSRIQIGRPDRPIRPIGSYAPGALFSIWRDALGSAIAAATPSRGTKDIRTTDRTDTAPVRMVAPEFFSLLGIGPELGTLFSGSTRGSSTTTPVVLSHHLWERLFDSRPDVVGTVIWVEDKPHTVIGVLPARFWFSEMNSPIWTLLNREAAAQQEALDVIVRRPPGIAHEALAAQLQSGLAEYASHLPAAERQVSLRISGVHGTPLGNSLSLLLPYVLGVSVLLTLLIACANVAILMIAQWTAREHEIAIRASLGASRRRIVRSLLSESTLLAFCGGALGVCATFALRGLIVHGSTADLAMFDLSIDPRVLIQSAIITLLSGVAAGLVPALYETRRLHANPLTTIASSDRVRQRWRHALVVLEITVTVALIVEIGAMVDGYRRQIAAELGFPTHPLLTARVENPSGVPAARIEEALRRLPAVASVAASTVVPLATAFGPLQTVAADAAGSHAVVAERESIGAGFFRTLDVPMRAGRAFADQDAPATRVVIVNESLANRLFPAHGAVGGSLWIGPTPYQIVGIVADYSNNPFQGPQYEPKLFAPLAVQQPAPRRVQFLIRATSDPAPLVPMVRRAIRELGSGTDLTAAVTLNDVIGIGGQEMLLGTAPLAPLIAIGILLTTTGIYGVLAFAITRRSRELAVRVAIGASGRDLVQLVAAHSIRLVTIGTALGIGVMFGLTRIVRASGGAGSVFDAHWTAFVGPVAIVVAIAAVATWIPSRRAMKINPAVLLRTT